MRIHLVFLFLCAAGCNSVASADEGSDAMQSELTADGASARANAVVVWKDANGEIVPVIWVNSGSYVVADDKGIGWELITNGGPQLLPARYTSLAYEASDCSGPPYVGGVDARLSIQNQADPQDIRTVPDSPKFETVSIQSILEPDGSCQSTSLPETTVVSWTACPKVSPPRRLPKPPLHHEFVTLR